MPYDSGATKKRLLDAALEEFAVRGLAGARVDRIAENATANKQAIYAYFGSKEDLFRAVLEERCDSVWERVAFDHQDLPSFVTGLFDHLVANPTLVRMTMWRDLELPGEPPHASVALRVRAIVDAYDLGAAPRQAAQDLFDALVGLAMASSTVALGLARTKGPAAKERTDQQRRALVAAAAAVVKSMAKKR